MSKFLTYILTGLIAVGLVAGWAPAKAYGATTTTTKSTKPAKVDINKASEAELEALPGIGATYAKKIIDGRPYKSSADLLKVGIPQATIDKIKPSITFSKVKAAKAPAAKKEKAPKKEAKAPKEQPRTGKIDINNATEQELEALPGVGTAYAKKIIDGRPYKTSSDLLKVGIPQTTIDKVKPSLRFGKVKAAKTPKEQPRTGKIDINNATEQELEALPGVGAAYAKKIIDGRPYKTSSDLLKVGIPQTTIDKIKYSLHYGAVKAKNAPRARATKEVNEVKETKTVSTPSSRNPDDIIPKVPPRKGMVWVNTNSKVYHKEGDRWYGKTEEGEFMTEDEAIRYGARISKQSD